MIARSWQEPNFRMVARDLDGNRLGPFVVYSDSEESLRQRMKEREDLTLEKVEPYRFDSWLERARRALERLKAAADAEERRQILEGSPLWQELKVHLFDLFIGKCAYCESRARLTAPGDVEHYRPKKGVFEEPGHPGYWWLAYAPANLLPACENCNRMRGKRTAFPVEAKTRAWTEEEVDKESPQLLNPYERDFDILEHVSFEKGMAEGRTVRGKKSARTYNLNRPGLGDARRQRQAEVIQALKVFYMTRDSVWQAKKAVEEQILASTKGYAAAALWALERQLAKEVRDLEGNAA